MNTEQLSFHLHALGECHKWGVLPSLDEKGLKEILQLRPITGQDLAVVQMNVFLEEAPYQIISIPHSVRFESIRSKQEARGLNPTATDDVMARLSESLFPMESLKLHAFHRCGGLIGYDCRSVGVQNHRNVGGASEIITIGFSEIRFRTPS